MTFAPIYGLKKTRIILYATDGVTPQYRITLQKEDREGLDLTFKSEGQLHQLGSGGGWKRVWVHRGWRRTLNVKWAVGVESVIETWVGSAWEELAVIPTAEALSVVHGSSMQTPCKVSPHLDVNLDFLAQPDPGKEFRLRDVKGVAHTGLELSLISTTLVSTTPDWENLNRYFAPGYIAEGYIGFVP